MSMECLRNDGEFSTAQSVDSGFRACVAKIGPRKGVGNRFLNGLKCPSEKAELSSLR